MWLLWSGLILLGVGILCFFVDSSNLSDITDICFEIGAIFILISFLMILFFGLLFFITRFDTYDEACLTTQYYQTTMDHLYAYKNYPDRYNTMLNEAMGWNDQILIYRKMVDNRWIGKCFDDWWNDVPLVEIVIP